MTNYKITASIYIQDSQNIVFKISQNKTKSENIKLGLIGWNLYRKYHIYNMQDSPLNGNQKTSIIAQQWHSLSKLQKNHWKNIALNYNQCGNRWSLYI
jgi:hypothetical protein